MSDGFLVLAKIQDEKSQKSSSTTDVPSCFFVPRWLPNGERNPFYIQRLKDKLGNRSNASSEIEFNNTQGVRLRMFLLHSLSFSLSYSSGYWAKNMMVFESSLK